MLSSLTRVFFADVDGVFFDGAGQTEQLDQPALVLNQRVNVATSQDLKARILYILKYNNLFYTS